MAHPKEAALRGQWDGVTSAELLADIQHRPRAANAEIWQMYPADPSDFRALGGAWHVNNPQNRVHLATGGYEVPVYEAFAGGFMLCRVMGGIRCYDLRKSP